MTIQRVGAHAHCRVEVLQTDRALVLRLCGELDMASRDAVEPALLAAVVSAESVIIDLDELTFCDSSGLAMFLAAQEKATAERVAFSIRNASPQVRRIFELTGLDRAIRFD